MAIKHRRKLGFTIVELVIVIVIIGILATIVAVAYGGTQRRAENSKVLAAVATWEKNYSFVSGE